MTIQSLNASSTRPCPDRKVKSGCQTCKRRKVKCDEGWPACRRCESAGRDCDGYGVWGGGSQRCVLQEDGTSKKLMAKWKPSSTRIPPLVLFRPVHLVALRSDERECFEWFIRRSAVKLPGVFASQHWTALVVQAGVSEPAVRHAILALSSAHKEEVRGFGFAGREDNNEQALFTVSQYSKAISHLQSHFVDTRIVSKQMALLSCVLFVSAEFLRGHYANGLLHLEHGLNLLLENRSEFTLQGPSTYVNGWIITMLTRHFVQAKLLGQIPGLPSRDVIGLGIQDTTDVFRSMHHARRNLEYILLRALDLQARSALQELGMTCGSEMLDEQKKVQADLQVWFETSTRTVGQFPASAPFMERFSYRLLQLYYYMISIIVNTCLAPNDEMQFDQHHSVFLKILSDCIDIYRLVYPDGKPDPRGHHDPEPSSPNSVSDIGWIPPLYYTAVKCRTPYMRHLAIRLLQKSPHREGIWNADLSVTVARKIVEIEESELYDFNVDHDKYEDLKLPSDDDLAMSVLPAEFRLSDLVISLPHNRAGKLLLSGCAGIGDHFRWIDQEYDLHIRHWIDTTPHITKRGSSFEFGM